MEPMLFGWTIDQWRTAFKWAGEELPSFSDMMNENKRTAFAAVRLKWLEADMPQEPYRMPHE